MGRKLDRQNHVEVTGMVLVSGGIGEYDRRIELLTKERGRISAFAKGARKPNSALVGATTPFVFGKFTLYAGRNSYTLIHAEVENYFSELRTDIEGAYYGFYFLEMASYYTREGSDGTQMLKLLYQSFRALIKNSISNALIRCIFELKAMTIEGEGPQVMQCVSCGEKEFLHTEKTTTFDSPKGGVLCPQCFKQNMNSGYCYPVDTSTLYTMQYIVCSSIEKLYTFTVNTQVLERLQVILQQYMSQYIDRSFKSLEMLEVITRDT